MPLTQQRKKQLRTVGHDLKPVVTVASKGVSAGVLGEIERALADHELIKIKLAVEDRAERAEIATNIADQLQAEVVQSVGKTLLLLKMAKKPNPKLSNLQRYKP